MRFKTSPSAPPTTPKSSAARSGGSLTAATTLNARGRRQPLILRDPGKPSVRFGEIVGETAAECAAVVCCCPCGLLELLLSAVVKLPAGLCRKAYRTRRRRINAKRRKAALLGSADGSSYGDEDSVRMKEEWGIPAASQSPEADAMEREMWAAFHGTGFWRSPSQREEDR